MVSGRHGGDLRGDNEDSAGKGDEDLTHHDIADISLWTTEVDHQAHEEGVYWDGTIECDRLVAACIANHNTSSNSSDGVAETINLDNVAGLGHAEAVDDLEKGAEEAIPAEEADEEDCSQQTCADQVAIKQQGIGDEIDRSKVPLPQRKENHQRQAEDKQTDDQGGAPAQRLQSIQVEGQQK